MFILADNDDFSDSGCVDRFESSPYAHAKLNVILDTGFYTLKTEAVQ